MAAPAQIVVENVNHLYRPPRGEWVLLDATTSIGDAGAGLATSRLADLDGTVGRGMQTLVVTRR